MKISLLNKTFIKALAISTTLTSCSQKEFKQLEHNKTVIQYIDNFTKSNYNKIDTINKFCFKKDTIQLNKDCFKSYAELSKYITKIGKQKNPHIQTGSKIVYEYGVKANGKMGFRHRPKITYELLSNPNSITAKVQNRVFTEKSDTSKIYIPVEFWGSANPKLERKQVEKSQNYQQFNSYFK